MKKSKKIMLTALTAVFMAVMSLFMISCGKNTVKFSFVTGDGATQIETQSVKIGEDFVLPVPVKDKYGFDGWYLNADFSGTPCGATIKADTDQTFYAKWTALEKITVNLDGGTGVSSELYLRAGENIYNFMQNYTPTKSGLIFGAWFDGANELTTGRNMPVGGITLTAKYKVEFTANIYKQKLDLSGYELDAEPVKDSYYVGATVSPEYTYEGFEQNTFDSLELKAVSSENTVDIYYNRKSLTVSFMSNGHVLENRNVVYGTEITVPQNYTEDGYCLLGWAEVADGEVKYNANYIDSVLYNNDGAAKPADKFMPSRTMNLYAVWATGYEDMLGGDDNLFILDETDTDIYLMRGGVMFKGTYYANSKEFLFSLPGQEVLEGRFVSESQFIYRDEMRAMDFPRFNRVNGQLVEGELIHFGLYDEITYYNGNDASEGTYYIGEDYEYIAEFTTGELAGKTLRFIIGTPTGVDGSAFLLRNEEEVALGTLVKYEYMYYQNQYGLVSYTEMFSLVLTGYDEAVYRTEEGYVLCYYNSEANGNILFAPANNVNDVETVRILEDVSPAGYMTYVEELDQTFTLANGATLKTDGLYTAVYTDEKGTVYEGNYYFEESLLGGIVITFRSENKTCKFVITANTTDGETTFKVVEKTETYTEFYKMSGGDTLLDVVLVFDSEAEGDAALFGMVASQSRETEYVKISSGTYEEDKATGYLVYNAATLYNPTETLVASAPENVKLVEKLIFSVAALSDSTNVYSVYYWITSTTNEPDATPENYYVDYENESNKLMLLESAGVVIFTIGGDEPFMNTCTVEGDIVSTSDGTRSRNFKINRTDKTFTELTEPVFLAYLMNERTGEVLNTLALKVNGEEGAFLIEYEVVNPYTGQTRETARYAGTITEKTVNLGIPTFDGTEYYTFTPTDTENADKGFDFIYAYTQSAVYVSKYNENITGRFTSEKFGRLDVDGCFNAEYLDLNGNSYNCVFVTPAEGEIVLIYDDDKNFYIDLDVDNKSFGVRGDEYGSYLYINNQVVTGEYYEFDGYNSFKKYEYNENDEQINVVEGTYTISGEEVTVKYNDGQEVTVVGKIGILTTSGNSYYAFFVKHEEIVDTYVSEDDWSVIKIDNYGNVEKFNAFGEKEGGTVSIITDGLLYYVNEAEDDANIFLIDHERHTVKIPDLETKGYYTKELDSLFFSRYGFAVFNGTDRHYYNILEDNSIMIYTRDPSNPAANKYGYVESKFADEFTSVKEYGDKTYYLTSGYNIIFNRVAANQNVFPVKQFEDESGEKISTISIRNLTFQPSGGDTFSVTGAVEYVITDSTGKEAQSRSSCTVSRELDESGVAHLYVDLANYRFEIEVNYNGDAQSTTDDRNTYTVKSLELDITAYSAIYVSSLELLYGMFGSQAFEIVGNNNGAVWITETFDENGDSVGVDFRGLFLSRSGILNSKNEVIGEVKGACVENANGTYTVTFVDNGEEEVKDESGEVVQPAREGDGYTYELTVALNVSNTLGVFTYSVFTFTRSQEIATADGAYTAVTEKMIYTDYTDYFTSGMLNGIVLKDSVGNEIKSSKNGEPVDAEGYQLGSDIYYIVREYDADDNITKTTYYKVNLTLDIDASSTANRVVALYKTVEVAVMDSKTVYSEDKVNHADIADGKVMLLYIGEDIYVVEECTNVEDTYTVKCGEKTFTVVISENVLGAVTEVTEEQE